MMTKVTLLKDMVLPGAVTANSLFCLGPTYPSCLLVPRLDPLCSAGPWESRPPQRVAEGVLFMVSFQQAVKEDSLTRGQFMGTTFKCNLP